MKNIFKKINKNIFFILIILFLLALFIFIFNNTTIEEFTTNEIINQINIIFEDNKHNDLSKIKAVSGIVYMMDDENDQKSFMDILNNEIKNPTEKIQDIKNLIENIKEKIEAQNKKDEEKNKTEDTKKKSDEAANNSPLRQYD